MGKRCTIVITLLFGFLSVAFALGSCACLTYTEKTPAVAEEASVQRLQEHVRQLCRVPRYGETIQHAREYIAAQLKQAGFTPQWQYFEVDGEKRVNISVSIPGRSPQRYVIGAHYDACEGEPSNPGADDNAGAVSVLLELARSLGPAAVGEYGLELVFYDCEEPPWFGTQDMGSARHAATCSPETVRGMVCLEMLGYYSDEPGSQLEVFTCSRLLLPSKGNFVAVVGDFASVSLARRAYRFLSSDMSALRLNVPWAHDTALYFSDHRNYAPLGIPAIMITDTAMLRNRNYHTPGDNPESLDYNRMALVSRNLQHFARSLAEGK